MRQGGLAPLFQNIPNQLKARDQWVLWRYEFRRSKLTKVPYAVDNRKASVADPTTWHSYEEAVRVFESSKDFFDGIGYVFAAHDPFTGIDLDHCIENERLKDWARPYVEKFRNSYCEVSPSGKGIKLFVEGELSGGGKKKDFGDHAIEIYNQGRFFTVTGSVFDGAPSQVVNKQSEIDELYEDISDGTPGKNKSPKAEKVEGRIPQGRRHATLVSLAGSMRRRGMNVDAIDAALQTVNATHCDPPYDWQHVRKIAESSTKWEPANDIGEINLLSQPFTDSGNAERLIARYGADLRYCVETKKWLKWDGVRWKTTDFRHIKALAKVTIRELYMAAALIGSAEDREAAEVHARRSESAKGINAMVSCAEYEPGIIVEAADLDREKYLLNAVNGTIELNTGQLRPHRREDFITKLVHFDYDPTAQCPAFLKFLSRIMGRRANASADENDGGDRLISYLQKCLGYATTADVSEKAVFCFHGLGRNGKTTLLEIIRYVIKEYSAQILVDNLIAHTTRESSASLADFADLLGARFVTTSEAEEGQRLALGKLKYLTQGTGEIKSCRKYENPVQFEATHKLFIDTNYKPVIRGADTASFDRLKLVPFNIRIPEKEVDKSLLEKLKREGPGILRWLVEGCARWFKEGLGDPPEIKEATDAWKAESDHVLIFLKAECVLARDLGRELRTVWVGSTQLWDRYTSWCEANSQGALPKPKFEDRLLEFGCARAKENNGSVRSWRGIGLRSSESVPEQGNTATQYDTFARAPEDL